MALTMGSNETLGSTRHEMGDKTSYEEGKKEETRDGEGLALVSVVGVEP